MNVEREATENRGSRIADRRSLQRDPRSPICDSRTLLGRYAVVAIGKKPFDGKFLQSGSSARAEQRTGRGDRVHRARLESMKKPPHRVVRGRVRRVRASR
jgi:hypothetical protein